MSLPRSARRQIEAEAEAPSGKIDLNTCSLEQLMGVQGLGEEKAKRILEQRPFTPADFEAKLQTTSGLGDTVRGRIVEQFGVRSS